MHCGNGVGRASGYGTPQAVLSQRLSTHHAISQGYGAPVLDRAVQGIQGYPAIRGREQQLIDAFGGVGSPNLGNRIRGVSRFNPFGRIYHEASDTYFGPLVKSKVCCNFDSVSFWSAHFNNLLWC